jgi:hypothetical protein
VAREEVGQGFKSGPDMALAGQEVFSARDVESYARSTCGEPFEASLIDIDARTDGRARRIMFEKFAAGTGGNQRDIVAAAMLPIACGQRARRAVRRTRFRLESPFRQSVGRQDHVSMAQGMRLSARRQPSSMRICSVSCATARPDRLPCHQKKRAGNRPFFISS